MASSTELSTTSWIRWCRPRSPVEPMYMPGRLRTASRPSRTVIEDALYSFFLAATGLVSPRTSRDWDRRRATLGCATARFYRGIPTETHLGHPWFAHRRPEVNADGYGPLVTGSKSTGERSPRHRIAAAALTLVTRRCHVVRGPERAWGRSANW